MESECNSLDSDEGVELSNGDNAEYAFLQSKHQPAFLEAEIVYIQLSKDVPVSRAKRFQWYLDHLNAIISIPVAAPMDYDYSNSDMRVVAVVPTDKKINKYLITPNTRVKFLAHCYRFVYCIDMSPSDSAVDTVKGDILFDQILSCFKTSLHGLCRQFTVPGDTIVYQPNIYLTVIVNTPFFMSPAQQVLVKGVKVSQQNLQEIIQLVKSQFYLLEGRTAHVSALAYEKIEQAKTENVMGSPSSTFDGKPNISFDIPMVLPEANFVNMLRYSILAISLLPENSLSHILVITDGVVAMPDSNMMESLLLQLHYESIAVSFLKVGSSFLPHSGAGYIAYTDLLHFISQSTVGSYMENFINIKPEPTMAMNVYHHNFLLWTFHSTRKSVFSLSSIRDNKWTVPSHNFQNSRVPALLTKRQTEENITASVLLLFSRRMREGYTIDHVKYDNGLLEVNLSLEWKMFIYIHYCVTCQWPSIKNVARIEVHISAPYEFLHDITCLMKKEAKSLYRQAVIERFWLRLTLLSSGDNQSAHQLSFVQNSSVWYTLPESVRSGMPLFVLNSCESSKFFLSPSDHSCPNFVKIWQPICQIESNNWKKWFHTHKFTVALKYDHPLPRHLHLANSSGRYQVVQCRQAATALYSMLAEWSSFVLIDNHTYIKLLYHDPEKPPASFCIVRVIPKLPCAVIRVGFMTGTPGYVIHMFCEELKMEFSTLTYLASPIKTKETVCSTLLENPLEKILIRYERMPSDFTTVIFPDGTQPPQSSQTFTTSSLPSTLFTTLSRYLHHKRWIWSTSHSTLLKLEMNAVSRILSTLTRIRIKEGFNFAHSSSGIITMVSELYMEPLMNCVVQYVLFPPHRTWREGELTSSSEEDAEPDSEIDSELQMITEVWVEPQYGVVQATNSQTSYLHNKRYFEIADAICQADLKCINALLTIEHLSLICQNKVRLINGSMANTEAVIAENNQLLISSRRNSRSSILDDISMCDIEERIQDIPFHFDPINVLPYCHQTELLFSTFIENNERLTSLSHYDFQKSNKLLLENLQEHLLCLHDHELTMTEDDSNRLTQQILVRHLNKTPHSCPISPGCIKGNSKSLPNDVPLPQWRCFIKGISVTHVVLTFIPAHLQSLKTLVGSEGTTTPVNDSSESTERASSPGSNFSDVPINANTSLTLPIYVYDCSLARLVNSYVQDTDVDYEKDDTYEDHRFKLGAVVEEDSVRLNDVTDMATSPEPRSDDSEITEKSAAKLHSKALILAHSKCFVMSLFSALQYGVFVHSSDVQLAMDQCEETLYDIDISYYMKTICGHLKQQDVENIDIELLQQPLLCHELKPFHRLIKDKFFEIMNIAFCPIPTNREFYYCRNLITDKMLLKADSDDEISIPPSDGVEFKSDKEISSSSEVPANSSLTDNKAAPGNNTSVSPLFVHLVCTVRYNNQVAQTSVKVLPTCLGELLQVIETESKLIAKSNLHLTLDILCLTLPMQVQNVLNDYCVKGLRTTSFCSDGFPPSIDSTATDNSYISDIPPDPLIHLPEVQRAAIINLRDKIKLLLKDEISTALLDTDIVTVDILKYVTSHVTDNVGCSSCVLDVIELHFVFGTEESYEKFEEEFSKTEIPRFKLQKQEMFYYITKVPVEAEEANIQETPLAEYEPSQYSVQKVYMDLEPDTNKNENVEAQTVNDDINFKVEVFSQQSDISSINDSFLGTDGGYDEDVSEDEEDFTWLMRLEDRRQFLPNFWLIMQMDQKAVTIYFHCRFLELPTTHVGTYLQVQRAVRDAIRDLCKRVNQFMLLRSLHDTRSCDFLLEPDDNNWHNENTTPAVTRNASFSRLKSMDETSDDCELYPVALTEISLNFTTGYFSCPVVWQAQFILHPRLKSGSGKPSLSRGVHALKTILDKFSVSNRTNMFVYKDLKSNVFYLRLYENFHSSGIKTLPARSVEYENAVVTRSPSIASLPQKSSILTQSQYSICSSTSRDSDIRPRVRSFGENETKDNPNEDMLILKVHGITEAGEDIRSGLVQVLQNRLDDAVLECLSVMLARNALCPLTPEDVHFLQKPFRLPEIIIKLSVQDYALKYLESFIHYLHQNLLQFLNIPKYTDSRSHYHFKDYSESETSSNKFLDENIFIYNQSQNPSSGSKGIACIAVAVIQRNDNHCHFDGNFAALFEKHTFQEIVSVKRIEEGGNTSKTYLEFRLWKQGKDVFTDNLFQKLSNATSQALWDLIMEYYLLQCTLCNNIQEDVYTFLRKSNRLIEPTSVQEISNSSTEVEFRVLLNTNFKVDQDANGNSHRNVEIPRIPIPSRQKKKYIPLNSTARRCIQFNDAKDKEIISAIKKQNIKLSPLELGQNGVVSDIYATFLQKWFDFGIGLSAPAVKKCVVNLSHRHIINVVIKELQSIVTQLSHDSSSIFQFLPLSDVGNETVLLPYGTFNGSTKCLMIARNVEQWKAGTMSNPLEYKEAVIPPGIKSFQKFVPVVVGDKFIPRQKILWAVITSTNILVYTYNWSKDKLDKLMELLTNLGSWLSIRASFLNSVVAQKLGIFYNQSITRGNMLTSNNPFMNYVTDVDCMLKFPKDRNRRIPSTGLSSQPVAMLETFRDSHHCIKIGHHDPVVVFAWETQELKRSDKKHKEELKKLHSLWQSRTSTCTSLQIDILKQNSRIIHFCFTPLLFLSGWRIQSASTRDYSLIQNSITTSNVLGQVKKVSQDEEWHNSLCYYLITEFKHYLQTLGFIPLKIENPTRKLGFPIKEAPSYRSVFFVQKAMLGGILIFTINLNEPFLSTKLYVIECNRLHSTNSRTSINQFTLSFLDECDRIKTHMHLHSFTYDYHLRCIHNYISNKTVSGVKLCEGYHLIHFLDEFKKYYSKAPNFARNLVHEEIFTIKDLKIEGKHLYDYLLSNVAQYGMEVFRMQDSNIGDTEYVLIHLSSTPQMSYKDSQDFKHTDDFHITVVITYFNSSQDPHECALSLKYYLILTCRREIYPKDEIDRTLGKFRKVSSTYPPMLAVGRYANEPEESPLMLVLETESEVEVDLNRSYDSKMESEYENPRLNTSPHVEIKQEFVNYLGYYSSHEQLMQQLILDRAAITLKKIKDMVTQGMVDCRTHLLWNKFVSHQDSNSLNYAEFMELKNLARLQKLCSIHPNLSSLLDQPLIWYQGLAKLLVSRYVDQHRMYVSPDGNIQHYAFLHPRYDGAFMLLSMDLHTSRGDLYAADRSSHIYKDSDIAVADRKALLDGFINCICFYIWTGLI